MAILGYAILNTMRLNAARLNFAPSTVYVTIAGGAAGSGAALRARVIGALIRDVINSTPATMTLRVSDTIPAQVPAFVLPAPGQEIRLKVGTTAPQSALFAGEILRRTQVKEGVISNPPAFDLECQDFSFLLDRRLAFGVYTNQPADVIVADLMTRYAPGFTVDGLERGLPAISITFTGDQLSIALSNVASQVGAKWKLREKDLAFYRTKVPLPDADLVTAATCETFDAELDLAQVRTRIYVKGIGVVVTAAGAVGATALTVADVSPFLVPGSGTVITEAGQVVSYASVQAAGYAPGTAPGTGPILAPPPAPTPVPAWQADAVDVNFIQVTNGSTDYRVVTVNPHGLAVGNSFFIQQGGGAQAFVVSSVTNATEFHAIMQTASSVSQTTNGGLVRFCILASSIRTRQGVCTVTTTAPHGWAPGMSIAIGLATPATYEGARIIATVPSPTTFTFSMSGVPADAIPAGTGNAGIPIYATTAGQLVGAYNYKATFASDTAETAASAASIGITVAGVAPLSAAALLSFTPGAGGNLIAGATYGYGVTAVTAAGGETILGALATPTLPAGNGLFNIGINLAVARDARVVAVNIWRSLAPGGVPNQPLKYIGSVSVGYRGAAMSFQDTLAENAVGGPAPTSSTANGAVLVANLAIGDPRVTARRIYRNTPADAATYKRAGELGDNVLTSWLDAVPDAALVTPAPTAPVGQFGAPGQLLGIPASGAGGIGIAIPSGSSVSLWVQRDDTAAQAALATLEGGDGIHESRIDDPTIATIATANAAGDAELAIFKQAEAKVRLAARDPKLQAGASVPVNMAAPTNVVGTFVVQSVTIAQLGSVGPLAPLRTIEAGTTWYQLQDLLRRVILG